MSVPARFWSRIVVADDGCWHWLGAKTWHGYGVVRWQGNENARVHRVIHELLVGVIPEGLQIDHLCRVRHCVNPAHMELVTSRENTMRGEGPTAANSRKTHCSEGHEFTPENTIQRARGWRGCVRCQRQAEARSYERRKARRLARLDGEDISPDELAWDQAEVREGRSNVVSLRRPSLPPEKGVWESSGRLIVRCEDPVHIYAGGPPCRCQCGECFWDGES
jgi:hypothetical protein